MNRADQALKSAEARVRSARTDDEMVRALNLLAHARQAVKKFNVRD